MFFRVVLTLCLLVTATAEADVYKYRDERGLILFLADPSDDPNLTLLKRFTIQGQKAASTDQPGKPPKSNGESAPTKASDDGVLTVTNMNGEVFPLIKRQWPISFRCTKWPDGTFMFSIRIPSWAKPSSKPGWLILPDNTGYKGVLRRRGLDWRFDWTDPVTDEDFSVLVKSGGKGYYFQWNLADDDGHIQAKRTMECK